MAHRYTAYALNDTHLYKFDLNNPSAGAQLMFSEPMGFLGMSFNNTTSELVTSTGLAIGTDWTSLDAWDINTNQRTVLNDDPFDQGAPDAHGHLVTYIDSQAAGEGWIANNLSQIKIIDRDTLEIRIITPYVDHQYNLAIWDKWLAFNNVGIWGDVLILCDLEAGGFIDTSGHVIPAGSSDAGVDGGK